MSLKTGCSIESRQHTSRQSLEALLGLLGVVAVFLLQMKTETDVNFIPASLIQTLEVLTKKPLKNATGKQILREIAKLGNFHARARDGDPGWQTIRKGWNYLIAVAVGFELARNIPRN